MMIKKLTVVGCVILSMGIGTGTGVLTIRSGRAQDSPAAAAPTKQAANPAEANARPVDPLVQKLLDASRQRFDAQRGYYEEGRITLDRFLDACAQLEKAELMAAADERERMAARRKYLDLLTEILQREQAELQVGRGTVADVAEAQQRHELAEMELRTAREDFDQYDSRALKLVDAARQRYEAQGAVYKENGIFLVDGAFGITINRLVDASRQLADAELRTAKTEFERIAIKKQHLDRIKEIEAQEEAKLRAGRRTQVDLAELTTRRIEAELDLHEAVTHKGNVDLTPILRRLGDLERKVEQLQKERGGQGRP